MSTVSTFSIPFREWETGVRVTAPDVPRPGALPLVGQDDQLGCGRSTHLPDARVDFWARRLFVDEFENLVRHLGYPKVHVLGQPSGGMLGAEIAVRRVPATARTRTTRRTPGRHRPLP
jgi:L-proline amide hydrolase